MATSVSTLVQVGVNRVHLVGLTCGLNIMMPNKCITTMRTRGLLTAVIIIIMTTAVWMTPQATVRAAAFIRAELVVGVVRGVRVMLTAGQWSGTVCQRVIVTQFRWLGGFAHGVKVLCWVAGLCMLQSFHLIVQSVQNLHLLLASDRLAWQHWPEWDCFWGCSVGQQEDAEIAESCGLLSSQGVKATQLQQGGWLLSLLQSLQLLFLGRLAS